LQGGDGDDYLAGGNGSGSSSGADRLEGGAGNDTLTAEDGANVLIGGAGDDDYVHGTGQDTIDNTGGGFDGVFFGSGVAVGNLAFTRTGDDLLITVNGSTTNTVRVTNHFLGGDSALDFVQPGSGNMLDTAAINALAGGGTGNPGGGDQGNDADYPNVVTGTAAGEQLLGTTGRDLIRGLGGNDTLFGFGGDDKFDGGDGDDYISGGNGSFSGSGNDILIGGAGADTLVGEDGNDRLFGGAGDDDYYYQGNSGSDLVYAGGGADWVFFNGIERTRLAFHQDGNDLIIRVDANANQQVRVANHFLGGENAIAFVQPGSGFAIPASQIPGLLTPLPASATAATSHEAMSDARAQLDNLIAAMASFNPGEAAITEYGPVRTAHYQLVATP
jgi:Ca2+-binding RTX toxin-like protein